MHFSPCSSPNSVSAVRMAFARNPPRTTPRTRTGAGCGDEHLSCIQLMWVAAPIQRPPSPISLPCSCINDDQSDSGRHLCPLARRPSQRASPFHPEDHGRKVGPNERRSDADSELMAFQHMACPESMAFRLAGTLTPSRPIDQEHGSLARIQPRSS